MASTTNVTQVPEPAPPREARQLLPVHAGAGRGVRHPGRAVVGAAARGVRRRGGRRRAGHAGVRVPGARGGHHVVDARAVRAPVAELHPLRQPLHPAPLLARRLRLHAPHVVLLQDLRRQLLLPPRPPPPDLVRPALRLPGNHGLTRRPGPSGKFNFKPWIICLNLPVASNHAPGA